MAIQAGVCAPGGRGAAEVAHPAVGARRSRRAADGVRGSGGGRSRSRRVVEAITMSHGGDDELHEEHEEHVNHEAWVIPYADLLTLLMAMFIALFAMSTVDMSKFKEFAIGFNEALGGGKIDTQRVRGSSPKDDSPISGNGNGNGPGTGGSAGRRQERRSPRRSSRRCSNATRTAGEREGAAKRRRSTRCSSRSTRKRLAARLRQGHPHGAAQRAGGHARDRQGAVRQRVGRRCGRRARRCSDWSARALQAVANPVLINGYTDDVPIATAQYPSNLCLSAPAPTQVARVLHVDRARPGAAVPRRARRPRPDRVERHRRRAGPEPPGRDHRAVEGREADTLNNAGLDKTPTTTPQPVTSSKVSASITPPGSDIVPHLGAS